MCATQCGRHAVSLKFALQFLAPGGVVAVVRNESKKLVFLFHGSVGVEAEKKAGKRLAFSGSDLSLIVYAKLVQIRTKNNKTCFLCDVVTT